MVTYLLYLTTNIKNCLVSLEIDCREEKEMKHKEAKIEQIVVNTHNPHFGLCVIVDNTDKRNAIIEELGKTKIIRHYAPYGQLKMVN